MPENYRALTRKYRPQSFEDIVSQQHVSNTLLNAIKQNRLSHAYMFCGPRGVGKTTMARVLARVINGVDASIDGESLNQTLNIFEMDAASNNKVEDIHLLRESVRIPPQNGRYKIFIVDEVHMLSKQAFNALLKTLEEPPKHAVFIFATTEPHKVLPTILSRVQRFDFKRIRVEEIVARLKVIAADEHIIIDEESLHIIAKKADGALRDALGLMDQAIAFCGDNITYKELLQALNVVDTERLFDFMSCVKNRDSDAGLVLINTLLQEGYDIQEFLIGLTEHLRNLYIARDSANMYLVEASEETKAAYKKSAAGFARDDLIRMLHVVSEAQNKLKDASQPRIQFEIMLLKLIHMEPAENMNKLLAGLEELKKNFSNQINGSAGSPLLEQNTVPDGRAEPAEREPSENRVEEPDPQKTEPEENSAQAVTENINPEPAAGDNYSLGRPTLLRRRETVKTAGGEAVVVQTQVKEVKTVSPKEIRFEHVTEAWPDYLERVRADFQMVLHLQIERVKPKKLQGTELVLECDNPLAIRMLEEQSRALAATLQECLGTLLRLKFVLINNAQNSSKARNPYERFKEIQEQDPILKEIVTRFGAELQY